MPGCVGRLCLATTLLMGLPLAGCFEHVDGRSIAIVYATFSEEESCEFTVPSDGSLPYSSSGMLDINHAYFEGEPSFYLGAVVYNYMRADPTENRVGSNYGPDVALERFDVRYKWLLGSELLQDNPVALSIEGLEHSMTTNGVVSCATSGDDPGRGIFAGTVLPKEVGGVLRTTDPQVLDELVLGLVIRVHGRTLQGDVVNSNSFLYPLYLCRDCLASQESRCWPGQESHGPQ